MRNEAPQLEGGTLTNTIITIAIGAHKHFFLVLLHRK